MSSEAKIVFVTSLERSGSTLLDLTLGRHSRLVSFGEVARVLLPHGGGGMDSVVARPCSCGSTVRECAFWGPVTDELRRREADMSLAERYALFLGHVRAVYGEQTIAVDSSKFLAALDAVRDVVGGGGGLRVLFTVRDVRGWMSSSRRAERRKREIPYPAILSREGRNQWKAYLRHNVLRHIPFWLPMEWYIRNTLIERALIAHGDERLQLSYEKLALEPDVTLGKVFEFIGIGEESLSGPVKSHIVRGNRMAFDFAKTSGINYDSQWMSELWTQYEAMAWPFIMARNVAWVHERKP